MLRTLKALAALPGQGAAGSPLQSESLARREALWHLVILLIFGLLFLHVYVSYPAVPRGEGVNGWEGWWDQSNYIGSARALAAGDFAPERHWYPIGYSMLGAPFAWLGMRDPFLLINLASFLIFVHFFMRLFRDILGAPVAAAVLAITLILPFRVHVPHVVDVPLLLQFVVPWNTNPVAALYPVLLVALIWIAQDRGRGVDMLIGAIAAGIVAVRFVEAVPLLVPGAVYAYHRLYLQRKWFNAVYALGGAFAVLVPVFGLTWYIHGGLASGYLAQSSTIGLSVSDIHERAVAIFMDAAPQFNEPETALFGLHPWLVVCLPLAAAWVFLDWRKALAPVLTAALATLVYLAYNDFSPLNVFRYALIHYMIWVLPVFAGAGLAGARMLLQSRNWKGLAAVLPAAALLTFARPDLVPMELTSTSISKDASNGRITYALTLDGSPEIDAIDLAGASAPDWAALTLAEVDIRIDGGEPLELFRDYRMFPAGSGIRVLMNSHIRGNRIELSVGDAMIGRPESAEGLSVSQLRLRLGGGEKADTPG